MLRDLQANILKGHGRAHSIYLVLRFDASEGAKGRAFLRSLQVTDALSQLQSGENYRRTGKSGGTITLCMLSAAGYAVLGVLSKAPQSPAFLAGMKVRQQLLNDPPSQKWDKHLRGPIHALVVLADVDAVRVRNAKRALVARMPTGVTIVGEEIGARIESSSSKGEAIEHFGYVDGRSNPLLLVENVKDEEKNRGGISAWNPQFALNIALVRDPAGAATTSHGSFVTFRKLEQDVLAFKSSEQKLAATLHLSGKDKLRAGAMVIGRFEDGTPLCLHARDGYNKPVTNNFNYLNDQSGAKCPAFGHIRRMNPRGDSVLDDGTTIQEERSHLLVRRGTTYGKRKRHPNSTVLDFADFPSNGVGLLFLAYQSSIENQFEFLQAKASNAVKELQPALTGLDPLIGTGPNGDRVKRGSRPWPAKWGNDSPSTWKAFDFQGYVKMLGGEYFFAPSISALKSL